MTSRQWLSRGGVTTVPVSHDRPASGYLGIVSSEQEHRERQLKRFSAMQNSEQHKHPEHAILDIPEPDYDPDAQEGSRNSIAFVEKFKNVICNIHIEELYRNIPEPDPDYQNDNDDDLPPTPSPLGTEEVSQSSSSNTSATATSSNSGPTIIRVKNGSISSLEDEGEQIQPRKLSNPCVESRERQALHKELLMNYRLGKDVLKKPELEKMMQMRKDAQKRKEWEEQKASKRTSFELMMEERANRLKADEDKMKPIQEKEDSAPELLRIHRKITSKPPS
ncbi:uncharacterized protein LOC112572268 isoform X3 [Pomacea canaliculata]|uniref:uncharacterized protein LOC112572268 isoform X3 n=1 Tax=Pomacea canaliculata TaxID=400727 RepID=UPI000D725FBF|nr:uncharacterized protein LOC112572268 isoform X3 [Pomacea canaliculata]